MKVLVTGGAGFIGSHIVEHFQGKADEIRVLDNLRSGYRENLQGLEHTFIEGSVTDRTAVREAVDGVDYIFHMAAMISVPESMEKPIECVEINTTGTLVVLEEATKAGVKKMCFSSSAANYGDNPEVPKVETMLPEPKSPYAITKLDGEYYCDMFTREGKLDTGVVRYFNVFGPRQDPGSAYAAAVPIFIDKAAKNETITIFGDGEQTRDFTFVENVVDANLAGTEAPNCAGRVFNIACGARITVNRLAELLGEYLGVRVPAVHVERRPGDVMHSLADIGAARDGLGYEPGIGVEDGLRRYCRYVVEGET